MKVPKCVKCCVTFVFSVCNLGVGGRGLYMSKV